MCFPALVNLNLNSNLYLNGEYCFCSGKTNAKEMKHLMFYKNNCTLFKLRPRLALQLGVLEGNLLDNFHCVKARNMPRPQMLRSGQQHRLDYR